MTRGGRGWLIAIEGIDGAGKSTLQRALARRLRASGYRVGLWREPTDRRIGARAQAAGIDRPWTAAMFFTIDRVRARARLDRLLARNDVVLSDRSFHSTLAYQGSALPREERRTLEQIQRTVTRPPDRVLWLRLAPRDALPRIHHRGRRRAPLERQRTLRRVARAYQALSDAGHWVTLDARRPTLDLVELALGQRGDLFRAAMAPSRQRR